MSLLDTDGLRDRVERLAAIERGSAGPGERRSAELIAAELESLGCDVSIELERVHGTYWWPVGLATGAAAAAGIRGGPAGSVAGAAAAAAMVDDLAPGPRFLRRVLRRRTTANVAVELGDRAADQTLVLVAHYDAARSGLVFHPELSRWPMRHSRYLRDHVSTAPPTMWGAVLGPAAVGLGSALGLRRLRRIGALVSAGYALAMTDIGCRPVVPGANDNATGAAVLLSLARRLAAEPPDGLRVILLFTGSEESILEGMQAWARRHFPKLPRETTRFLCIDSVGAPDLLLLAGEGMLRMHHYRTRMHGLLRSCARDEAIPFRDDLRLRNCTDGLIPLRAGYDTAMLGSVDELKMPGHYHWPTDTPDRVDYETVAQAAELCRAAIDRLASSRAPTLAGERVVVH